jgi:hypothetical protein
MTNVYPHTLVETSFYHNTQHHFQTVDSASYQSASIIPGPSSNLPGLRGVALLRQAEDGFDPPVSCP